MNIKLIAATAALLACATPSFAVPVSMNFEGTTSFASVDDYYNGGPGTNYHVAFGDDLLAFTNDAAGTYFSGPASLLSTVMAPEGPAASITVTSGLSFAGAFSFLYSATQAFDIYAFDRNGGNVGTLHLVSTDDGCSVDIPFCSWNQATLNLTGLARRIDLSGGLGISGFDNITATTVPAPAPVFLMASGLAMLGRMRMRRKRAA